MQYSMLGATGLVVSRLSFGAMTFAADPEEHSGPAHGLYKTGSSEAERLVSRALEAGVNFFDTADLYCQGQSEEILGKALGRRREEVVLTTKVGHRTGSPLVQSGLTRRHILSSIDRSLQRLGTDWVDVYMTHVDDNVTPLEEQLVALDDVVRAGKARYLGYSNWSAWRAAAALEFQKANGLAQFTHGQMHYSLVGRDIETQHLPMMRRYGNGLTVWGPLAGGFLSGKYTRDDIETSDGRLADFDFLRFDKGQGFTLLDVMRPMVERLGASFAQIAIAWLLAKPWVSSVILGASKLSQLDDNLGAAGVALASTDVAALDSAMPPALAYPEWMIAHVADRRISAALKGGEA
jgi:aryl-alcohol dehydrogenase-like predicted oxidoreductase